MDDRFVVLRMPSDGEESTPEGREKIEIQVRILEAMIYMREHGFEEVDTDYVDARVSGRIH